MKRDQRHKHTGSLDNKTVPIIYGSGGEILEGDFKDLWKLDEAGQFDKDSFPVKENVTVSTSSSTFSWNRKTGKSWADTYRGILEHYNSEVLEEDKDVMIDDIKTTIKKIQQRAPKNVKGKQEIPNVVGYGSLKQVRCIRQEIKDAFNSFIK